MDNREMLAAINTVMKDVTDISDFGDAVLQPAKLNQFIRQMQHRTRLLPDARQITMDEQKSDIDRTGFTGRILRSGSNNDGTSRTLSSGSFAKPFTATNQLVAQELQAVTSIRDRALRRNIERGNYENTMIDLFGEAAGRDMEEFALLSDTNIPFAEDDVLSQTNGWVRKAANHVYGRSWDAGIDVGDFDVEANNWPVNLFQVMIDSLPKVYFQDASEWLIGVDYDIFDAYRNWLMERETSLGDEAILNDILPPYKGVEIRYVPLLGRAATVDLSDETEVTRDRVEGRTALLTNPDNMAWGIFHEVTVEPEREAKERRTDFVLTMEGDAHYEDENAVVAAHIDKANPS